ncbi:hypothetical protein DMENIID0001_149390 [Sergentomyia squamirostris]
MGGKAPSSVFAIKPMVEKTKLYVHHIAKRIDRVEVLRIIAEKKEVLFGRFSAALTHDDKQRAWDEVCAEGKAMGWVGQNVTSHHIREISWQNWRKRTIQKRNGMSKTGAAGGKRSKLDAGDEIVLDIVGRQSAQIVGINLPEASGTQISEPEASTSNADDDAISRRRRRSLDILSSPPPSSDNIKVAGPSSSSSSAQPQRPGPKPGTKGAVDKYTAAYMKVKTEKMAQDMAIAKEEAVRNKEKWDLQCHLLRLQCLERERALNIGPSNFTAPITEANPSVENTEGVLTSGESVGNSGTPNIIFIDDDSMKSYYDL